jgi:aminopeptidase N
MHVVRVTAPDGAPIPFAQRIAIFTDDSLLQVAAIAVTPPVPIAPGDSTALVVAYAGYLVGYVETGSLYIKDHVSRDFTILRTDAFAFPSLGVPSWQANRMAPDDPFAFTADITVPADLVVAAGGAADAPTIRDSLATWHYRSTGPVPFLNIAIAPYRVFAGDGVRIFALPADSSGARQVQAAASSALDRYSAWFGVPGRRPLLTVMEIPEGYGSQASLTAGILQTADAFQHRSELRQMYHELSHVWNVADLDRPSPRWNEGLASFLEWRMAGALDGWADWPGQLDRTAARLRRACAAPGSCDSVPMLQYGQAGRTDLSYSVGMIMFYALYRTLGPDTFDRAYRDFFQRYRTQGAHTADLVAAFHAASPASDPILHDWLLTTAWVTRLQAARSIDEVLAAYRH